MKAIPAAQIHEVCRYLQAGDPCQTCPEREDTGQGPGQRACRSLAEETIRVVEAARGGASLQPRVQDWLKACFDEPVVSGRAPRNRAFLEEALELVQSLDLKREEAHAMVDYVFDRDAGEPTQEVGGVLLTLAPLCTAAGIDMIGAGETELARVWTKIDKIRAKQAAKPKLDAEVHDAGEAG